MNRLSGSINKHNPYEGQLGSVLQNYNTHIQLDQEIPFPGISHTGKLIQVQKRIHIAALLMSTKGKSQFPLVGVSYINYGALQTPSGYKKHLKNYNNLN